jgi:hypothetical protein
MRKCKKIYIYNTKRMKTVNIDFIKLLRESYISSNLKEIEEIGYNLDTDLIQGDKILLYRDERIKSIIVIVKGLNDITKDFNIFKIPNIVNEANDIVKNGEVNIKKIIEKYNEYNIIFIGHSLGGYVINKNLKNTKYQCYTYNPFLPILLEDTSSNNIKNYRTSGDILSIGKIGKQIETIEIDIINYLINNKFNIINYLKDSHFTTILHLYNISLNIEITVYTED